LILSISFCLSKVRTKIKDFIFQSFRSGLKNHQFKIDSLFLSELNPTFEFLSKQNSMENVFSRIIEIATFNLEGIVNQIIEFGFYLVDQAKLKNKDYNPFFNESTSRFIDPKLYQIKLGVLLL
jgi:hypothetical protein